MEALRKIYPKAKCIRIFHQGVHRFDLDSTKKPEIILVAEDLSEVGSGTVFSFRRVRQVYLNEFIQMLACDEVRSCCQLDKQALLNRLFFRYGVCLKTEVHAHAQIGILNKGQKLIIIKVRNIEQLDRLVQEGDLNTEEQFRKAGIEFELHIAKESKFQKLLPRPTFTT